ncbi:MAG: glycosyltransferase [Acidimicrobiales bacterium]
MTRPLHIGLIAPAPVPETVGGAERLWRSLAADLVARGHRAEVVAIPTPETTLAEVLEGYRAFVRLDVTRFDLVVTGKYPAWMVSHPRHVRYLLHPLRGLYDTYPARLGPLSATARGSDLVQRLDAVSSDPDGLIEVGLELVRELGDDPLAAHPGPLARELVHRLDDWATQPGRIALHAAISEEVAARPGYIPADVPVAVVHPASDLPVADGAQPIEAFVTASRLDRPKRTDLILDAFSRVRDPDARLVVCGDGPERATLHARAARDPRVTMAGFVSEVELAELYAGAVAVPFVPDREDFGYVSLEAMRAGTPVITTTDSGGAKELVVDGGNGLVVDPFPEPLARAMHRLWSDRTFAWRLGAEARRRAERVSWLPLVRLLESVADDAERPRATAMATFAIDPAIGGGQRRLRYLLRGLAERVDVTALCLTSGREGIRRRILEPGLIQVEVGRSAAHRRADTLMTQVAGLPVDDIGSSLLWPSTPAWQPEVIRSAPDVVVASHPFLTTSVPDDLTPPVIYESQDAEHHLKARVLPSSRGGRWLLDHAIDAERSTIERAALVTTTTETDADLLRDLVGPSDANRHWSVASNGVDTVEMPFRTEAQHQRARREVLATLALSPEDTRHLIVFIGSWHPPNLEAASLLVDLARSREDILVVLAGSHTAGISDPPSNVRLLGPFPETFLWPLLAAADVAINPMTSGSGSNLKLLDYLAVGVPVVTTPTGARGIADPTEIALIVEPTIRELHAGVDAVLAAPDAAMRRVQAGRRLVEDHYDWTLIARGWTEAVMAAAALDDLPTRELTPTGRPTIWLPEPSMGHRDPLIDLIRAIRHNAVADHSPSATGGLPMDDQLHHALDRARENRNVGQIIPERARLRAPKRLIARIGKVLSTEQLEYNEAILDAAGLLAQRAAATQAQLTELEGLVRDELITTLAGLRDDIDDLRRVRTRLETEVRSLRTDHKSVMAQAQAAIEGTDPGEVSTALRELATATTDPTHDELYQDFEDAFRGSFEDVTDVLREYLTFVTPLAGGQRAVLDVGCGRGEWLTLCRDAGVPAYGVDTNARAVSRGVERGLDVRLGDALAHLRDVPDGSLGAITSFHVVEHLPFDLVVELTDSALRALAPGGVLIYETPNCRNLQVGAGSFWLDPTHMRPVHPTTLGFLLEHRGFVDVEVMGLHPAEDETKSFRSADLDDAVNGFLDATGKLLFTSQDVCVIGRKMAAAP